MARQYKTIEEPQLLSRRVVAKAAEIRAKYGPRIGWDELLRMLDDRDCVAFPCQIEFNAEPLLPGEFAHPAPQGLKPEDGFIIYLHPIYASQRSAVPLLVLHQLVLVNFGHQASPDDAERFGAEVLGLSQEEYYRNLCELAGQVGGDELC